MRPTLCPSPPSPPKLWSTTVRKHKIHFHLPLMCLLNYIYTNLDKRETSILIDFSKASDHSTGIKKEPCEDLVRWLAGSPPGHVLSVPYMWSEPGHQARPAVLLSVNKRCPPMTPEVCWWLNYCIWCKQHVPWLPTITGHLKQPAHQGKRPRPSSLPSMTDSWD